jgi:3-hydroxyisobutyrate dehydrogenase-like beta-hydroxyacid dehydrogenase
VLVSHTTGAPSLLNQLAVTAPRIGIVDAAISGSPNDIEQGRLTVMLGGEPSAVQAARAVVNAYADPIIETGPLGSAMVVKLLNNMLFAANAQLVAAAAAAGQPLGIEPDSLLTALDACSGGSAAGAWIQRTGGLTIFEERVAKFVGKDIATAVSVAAEVNANIDLIRRVAEEGPLALATVD